MEAKLSTITRKFDGSWVMNFVVRDPNTIMHVSVDAADRVKIEAPWEDLEREAIARALEILEATI